VIDIALEIPLAALGLVRLRQGDDARDAPYRGWSLARMALFYFVVPLGCAIGCAALAPTGIDSRSLAALAGLAGGMLLTTSLAGRWTRRLEEIQGGAPQAHTAKETHDG